MSAVLSVRGVSKRFGALRALDDVSFDVDGGELVALIGPNGAGKTTLLSIVAGAQAADAGSVVPSPREVGWAPQQPAIYSKLSVVENIELFARLEGVADPAAESRLMLEQTGLQARASEQVGNLSGGNRQRVNVALALIGGPRVLVLDEPSAALDPAQRERMWEFVAGRAAAGTAVVFSTHNVSEAQVNARRVLVLADGRLRFDGAPDALLRAAGMGEQGELEHALVSFLASAPS